MNIWQKILVGVLTLMVGMVIGVQINRVRLNRMNAALVDDLLAETNRIADGLPADLPAPVQRYLSKALGGVETYPTVVSLEQRGDFRLGDASSAFIPFSAVQHMTAAPPGFVWDADMQMMPMMGVNVVDAYVGGEGILRARLLSTITVAEAEPGQILNEGELIRYLAESVWLPTALLPENGVTWEAVDDLHARATLSHEGIMVSLLFTFNADDEVVQIFSESRGRDLDGTVVPTPWTGRFWNYQIRDGLWIPTEGEVEWNLPEGDLVYWRGVIETATYRLP